MNHIRSALAVVLLGALALAGCASPTRLNAVPVAQQAGAEIEGMPGIRYRPSSPGLLMSDALEAFQREQAMLAAAGRAGQPLPPVDFLAISGGGENGAFGAGLLNGWSTTGTRPEFKLVTGISTGALTAPFAFLGPRYDAVLRQVYTETSAIDILEARSVFAALWDDAMADTAPLRRLVARFLTAEMLAEIKAEHEKGRILLVASTDLDAREPVLWNITKIAASGHPDALALIHKILVASASIPGAFPPVMIDVVAGGKRYQEMHVDGGVMAQVFVYPPAFRLGEVSAARGVERVRRAWVIRNARLDPDWADVDRRTMSILSRSITGLIQSQGTNDLFRIHAVTQRDGVDFNLAYMPSTFNVLLKEPFDREYMSALYKVANDLALKGYPWAKQPPTLADLANPRAN